MTTANSIPGRVGDPPLPLPYVVLTEIFRYISTLDLLHNCRLVSKAWHQYMTANCRNRHVRVKQLGDAQNVSEYCIHDTFSMASLYALPWSNALLTFDESPVNRKFCAQICEVYGTYMQSLTAELFETEYDNFLRALRRMPNLQELKFAVISDLSTSINPIVFPQPPKIRLSKLTFLKIEHQPNCQFVDLLDFLLNNTGVSLRSLYLSILYANEDPENEFPKIVELIYKASTQVSKLALKVSYGGETQQDFWGILAGKRHLKIHELVIASRNPTDLKISDGNKFHLLERFLTNCIGINSLTLENFEVHGEGPISTLKLLQFPILCELKSLNLKLSSSVFDQLEEFEYNSNPQYPLLQYNLLNSGSFPNLEYDETPFAIDIRKLFDSCSKPFKNVKTLHLANYYGFHGRLAKIFPKVNKITVVIEDYTQFGSIFEGMKNLTELELILYSDTDNNPLLTQAFEFIRPLENLTKLIVRSHEDYCGKSLKASGIIVLALLHPLNLTICNVEMNESDRCVSLLRASHYRLELLQKY